MYIVYILQSKKFRERLYVGFTYALKKRVVKHNKGDVKSTRNSRPWRVVYCSCFTSKKKAIAFEKYLKSSSGKAFMKKRLITIKA